MTDKKSNVAKFVPKVKKAVTLPLLKLQIDVPAYIRFNGEMFVGKEIKGKDQKMEPATLANVTNLETGEECQIIVNAVLKSILTENYANNGYVGKGFEIIKLKKASGKRYNPFAVSELEL